MDLFVTDSAGNASARVRSFTLDMAFGADENDFTLELGEAAPGIGPGSLVFVPGTEYGGIVGKLCPSRLRAGDAVAYEGQTWHGILDDHVIEPPSGSAYRNVSGDADAVMGQLVSLLGLGGIFSARQYAGIDVKASLRYQTAYAAITDMLAASGARLQLAWDTAARRCVMHAVPVRDWGDVPLMGGTTQYSARLDYRPVNHLIALGKGEGAARKVIHLYADGSGNISTKKSLSGIDERTYVYDYSNAEDDKLMDKARDKLAKLRQTNEIDVDLDSGAGVAVGDTVTAYSPSVGVATTGTVTKLTVKVEGGHATATPSFAARKDETTYE